MPAHGANCAHPGLKQSSLLIHFGFFQLPSSFYPMYIELSIKPGNVLANYSSRGRVSFRVNTQCGVHGLQTGPARYIPVDRAGRSGSATLHRFHDAVETMQWKRTLFRSPTHSHLALLLQPELTSALMFLTEAFQINDAKFRKVE